MAARVRVFVVGLFSSPSRVGRRSWYTCEEAYYTTYAVRRRRRVVFAWTKCVCVLRSDCVPLSRSFSSLFSLSLPFPSAAASFSSFSTLPSPSSRRRGDSSTTKTRSREEGRARARPGGRISQGRPADGIEKRKEGSQIKEKERERTT